MWSKNGIPEASRDFPDPSTDNRTVIAVSDVVLSIIASRDMQTA
jgi:hypothetical protein